MLGVAAQDLNQMLVPSPDEDEVFTCSFASAVPLI